MKRSFVTHYQSLNKGTKPPQYWCWVGKFIWTQSFHLFFWLEYNRPSVCFHSKYSIKCERAWNKLIFCHSCRQGLLSQLNVKVGGRRIWSTHSNLDYDCLYALFLLFLETITHCMKLTKGWSIITHLAYLLFQLLLFYLPSSWFLR